MIPIKRTFYNTIKREKHTIVPLEHDEQITLHEYVEASKRKHKNILLNYAVPNGGDRNARVGKKLKAEGVKRGIPDYVVVMVNFTLYIEMKRAKKSLSSVTKEQKEAIEQINKGNTSIARVAYGAKEAIELVKFYVKLDLLKSKELENETI